MRMIFIKLTRLLINLLLPRLHNINSLSTLRGRVWEDKGPVNGFFCKKFFRPPMGPAVSKKVFAGNRSWGTLCSVVRSGCTRKGGVRVYLIPISRTNSRSLRVPAGTKKPALGGLICWWWSALLAQGLRSVLPVFVFCICHACKYGRWASSVFWHHPRLVACDVLGQHFVACVVCAASV